MTTIKIREVDKRRFDKLQHEYIVLYGKKISQQELFSMILDYVERNKEDFFKIRFSKLSEEDIKKYRELQEDWGVETREEEIDSIIYDIH